MNFLFPLTLHYLAGLLKIFVRMQLMQWEVKELLPLIYMRKQNVIIDISDTGKGIPHLIKKQYLHPVTQVKTWLGIRTFAIAENNKRLS